jgi:RHS repeat-associated protein
VTVVVEPGLADTGFHVFDGWRQVAQHTLHVSGSSFYAVPTKQFVWGARLDEMLAYRRRVVVSSVVSWEVYYVLHGGQDTAAKLVDAGGVVRERYEYDPYGMVKVYSGAGSYLGGTSPLGLAFLWKAVRLDAETGLLYMRNRYYSTGLGRFLTRDPIGVWGDELNYGNETAYAAASPLSLGDPFGLQGEPRGQFQFVPTIVGFGSVNGQAFVMFSDGSSLDLPADEPFRAPEVSGDGGGFPSPLGIGGLVAGALGYPVWPYPRAGVGGGSRGRYSTYRRIAACLPKETVVPASWPLGSTNWFNYGGRILARAGWGAVVVDCWLGSMQYYSSIPKNERPLIGARLRLEAGPY